MIETGSEPEFFVTGIAKFEIMTGGLIRLYLATQKGHSLRLEYTAIVPADALAAMGRACLHMAAEGHTWATFQEEARTH
jgi:hypothetical protein